MKTSDDTIARIIESLKTVDPFMIFLFGSRASGTNDSESDIDLVVVLDDQTIPSSYSERMERKLLVRKAVYELSKKVQIDLVVYTKGEYEQISHLKTSFYNTIKTDGIVLYEKAG